MTNEELEIKCKSLVLNLKEVINDNIVNLSCKEGTTIVSSTLAYLLGNFIESMIKEDKFKSKIKLLDNVYKEVLAIINHYEKERKHKQYD
jgi:hypothetical protein